MPGEYFYFDMRQTPQEDGHDWAAIFDAKKVYGFDFAKLGFTEEQMQHVVGLEGTFSAKPTFRTIPNSPTTSTICVSRAFVLWPVSHGAATTRDGMRSIASLSTSTTTEWLLWASGSALFPPKITYRDGVFTAATDDGSQIYYIKEGSDDEHRYKRPLHTDQPHLYRFFTRYRTARSPYVADKSYHRTIVPAFTLTTSMGESSSTPYSNAENTKVCPALVVPADSRIGSVMILPMRFGAGKCICKRATVNCRKPSSRPATPKYPMTANDSNEPENWKRQHHFAS